MTTQSIVLPGAAVQQAADLREAQTDIKNIYLWLRVIAAGILLLMTAQVGTWVWIDARFGQLDARFERLEGKIDRVLYYLIENKPEERESGE